MKHILTTLILLYAPLPAYAHKVIAGVFPSGKAIEGEIGFSNGDMAANTEVIITAPDGSALGRATTDADGFFLFTPTKAVTHKFHADLGAGHIVDVTMVAEDVARILGVKATNTTNAAESTTTNAARPTEALSAEAQQAIATAVRDEIRPLRREIAAYREHNNLQNILGGIGYIIGLFGLAFYLAARRKLASK